MKKVYHLLNWHFMEIKYLFFKWYLPGLILKTATFLVTATLLSWGTGAIHKTSTLCSDKWINLNTFFWPYLLPSLILMTFHIIRAFGLCTAFCFMPCSNPSIRLCAGYCLFHPRRQEHIQNYHMGNGICDFSKKISL